MMSGTGVLQIFSIANYLGKLFELVLVFHCILFKQNFVIHFFTLSRYVFKSVQHFILDKMMCDSFLF